MSKSDVREASLRAMFFEYNFCKRTVLTVIFEYFEYLNVFECIL